MNEPTDRHSRLKASVRDAAEGYLDRIAGHGWSDEAKDEYRWRLARAALMLHLHERGMRQAKRVARRAAKK